MAEVSSEDTTDTKFIIVFFWGIKNVLVRSYSGGQPVLNIILHSCLWMVYYLTKKHASMRKFKLKSDSDTSPEIWVEYQWSMLWK